MLFDEVDQKTPATDFVDLDKTLTSEAVDLTKSEPEVAAVVEPVAKPSRYAGKTTAELEQMLEDAQAHIGRQSSEIGEVRKLADALVQKSLIQPGVVKTPAVTEEIDDGDFFADPAAAINRAVSNHPEVIKARDAATQLTRDRATAAVQAKHPDMKEVLSTPAFAEWVKASPMRGKMYAMADQGFDVDAADELLSNFKASAGFTASATATATEMAVKANKAASEAALKAGGVGTSNASSAPAPKKYRRADIIRLMTSDPRRYEAMADEILLAYSEGRVV